MGRILIARGMRRALRDASPLVVSIYLKVSTEGAKYRRVVIPLFQSFIVIMIVIQGRRDSLRSTLAPGYHIPAPLALRPPHLT
jgi:hypothetical protein